MKGVPRLPLGLAAVLISMIALFTVPETLFVPVTFVATTCMIGAAYLNGAFRGGIRLSPRKILFGGSSAVLLYLIFYAGAFAIDHFHPLGIDAASEASIYSLIASSANPLYLQAAVLLFDSAGYESFFRGVLQLRLERRLGLGAAPAVALIDASIHVLTLNPVWVAGTFITDLVWGLTYHYGKGTQASFTSHLLWDIAIFMLKPVT